MPSPTSTFIQSGRFTNVRNVGQGVFGKVYYAKDNVGRDVAIKEALPINPYFQDTHAGFEREARIQAALQQQNIEGSSVILEGNTGLPTIIALGWRVQCTTQQD